MRSTSATVALAAAGLLSVGLGATTASAQVNIAAGKPVIGGSGSWNGNPTTSGQFSAQQVTDNVGDVDGDPNSGGINEPSQTGFWLGDEQQANEFFVLDLQNPVAIGRIDLFNTHNAGFNDRGTQDFTIDASNAVDGNGDLTDAVTLLTGTLAQTFAAQDPIEGESFAVADSTPYRYLRFTANTFVPPVGGFGGAGLNEIRVYEVPEPTGLALLGLGAAAMLFRRSKRRA